MGDVWPQNSDAYTEKTEPFSQSELELRLRSHRAEEMDYIAGSPVPLDDLQVPPEKGIRILMRPLTRHRSLSPANQDNCEWLDLGADIASQDQIQHKVLAVTQTSRDIKFTIRIVPYTPSPPVWCDLYYNPNSDDQILYNHSDMPISLFRLSSDLATTPLVGNEVNPETTKSLAPGTWRIHANGADILDFRILEKPPAILRTMPSMPMSSSLSSESLNSSGKRPLAAPDELPPGPGKRIRPEEKDDDRVTMFLRPQFLRPQADSLPSPPVATDEKTDLIQANGHALLNLREGQSVEIPGNGELYQYEITKREGIASTTLSSVFKADHSHVPDDIITVKVLRTRPPHSEDGVATKPQETERNVVHQANIWLREFQSHDDLRHESIVRLYGGDARYLSLYMEHIDARDITAKELWRNEADHFCGDRADAGRILRDIAGALHYMHKRKLIHNDIKPSNILYSCDRGAVLCDFGMSTAPGHSNVAGGTPYYVPPEFIGRKLRGAPSDVWALGITMLYVLRKMPFPEARGRQHHPRRLHWYIADINRQPTRSRHGQARPTAVSQMQQWLLEVREVSSTLNMNDAIENLVARMLLPQPNQRVTMSQVMAELFPEQTLNT